MAPHLLTWSSFSAGVFGRRLNVWNLSCRTLTQCFDLGEDSLPLSVKFLHNPDAAEGYVSCALSGIVYRFYKCEASVLPAAGETRPWGASGRLGKAPKKRGVAGRKEEACGEGSVRSQLRTLRLGDSSERGGSALLLLSAGAAPAVPARRSWAQRQPSSGSFAGCAGMRVPGSALA